MTRFGSKLVRSVLSLVVSVVAMTAVASAQAMGTTDATGGGDFGGVLWIWGWLLVGGGALSFVTMLLVAARMSRR